MTQPIQQPQIPQLSPQEAAREMTPAEVRQLQDAIQKVRKVIAKFHDTRRRNNERMAGLRAASVWPQQVQEVAQRIREPQIENQAVETLRQFLRVIRGHEPSRQEMQEGIPGGLEDQVAMGGIPLAVGAVAVALGASVYSVFNYLGNHEQLIAQQTATPLERGLTLLSENIWGVAAVGAVVGGVYVYHRSQNAGEQRHKRELEKIREMGRVAKGKGFTKNPSHKLDDEEVEEESFFTKAKEFIRNGLFPGESSDESSSVKKLMSNYERLTEEEKSRFAEMMSEDSEEVDEEEMDEEEVDEEEVEVEENPTDTEEEVSEDIEEEEDTENTEDQEEEQEEEETDD